MIKDDVLGHLILRSLSLMDSYLKEVRYYKKNKKYNFSRLDSIEVKLYFLKNAVHEAFRRENAGDKVTEEDLFDLILGSIFHETLHLKEYVYTLEYYKQRYEKYEKAMESKKTTHYEREFLIHCCQIVDEAHLGLPEKTKELEDLYKSALYQIEVMLKKKKNNSSIVRMLYMNCNIIRDIYRNGIKQLYEIIYKCGAIEGYFVAGKHFMEKNFMKQACEAFDNALNAGKNLTKYSEKCKEKEKIISQTRILRKQCLKGAI